MPEFAKPVQGNFCWTEVFLEDPGRGKGFYGELFGWSAQEIPSPEGTYSMLHLGGKLVAGIGKITTDRKKAGTRPGWLNHVFVRDTDALTKRAAGLGAKIVMAPMQVGQGMMAIIEDPTGNRLALWSTKESMGTFLWGETNALCWNELVTADAEAATKFYVGMFGWKTEAWPMGEFTYTVLKNGDVPIAGVMPLLEDMKGTPSGWTAYFGVADCDAIAKKAEKLGGKINMPPHDIPNVGRFAVLGDPEGATFAILKSLPRS